MSQSWIRQISRMRRNRKGFLQCSYRSLPLTFVKTGLSQVKESISVVGMGCNHLPKPLFCLIQFLFAGGDHTKIVQADVILRSDGKLGQKLLASLCIVRSALQEIRQSKRGTHARLLGFKLHGFRKMRSGLFKITGLPISEADQGMRARIGFG